MTNCPNCEHDLEATLFIAAYNEMQSLEITESADVPVYITCENCLTEYDVMLEVKIELISVDFRVDKK